VVEKEEEEGKARKKGGKGAVGWRGNWI